MTATAPMLGVDKFDVALIDPDPAQARDEGADDELSASIKANGVLQPIELRRHPTADDRFMIVDGERRFRGAVVAGLKEIPATVTLAADAEGDRLVRQVVRNDGKRLKAMEEARTFQRIMKDKGWTIQQLAEHIGKSKSTVSDRVAMAEAPGPFVKYFERGLLGASAAPLIRPLADLPAGTLERMAAGMEWVFNSAAAARSTVDNLQLEQQIKNAIARELRLIDPKMGADYKGKRATIGKQDYAVDVSAYDAVVRRATSMATSSTPVKLPGKEATAPAAKADPAAAKREREAQAKRDAEWEAKMKRDRDRAAAERKKQEELEATFEKILPAALDTIAEKIKRMPTGVESQLGKALARDIGGTKRAAKRLGKGRTAEDLVRLLALDQVLASADSWQSWRTFPSVAKEFGVDIAALVKAQLKAADTDKPAKAKKKARR